MRLLFPILLYQRMRAFVDHVPGEISGFGKLEAVENDMVVQDIQIFDQTVTGGNTVIDHISLAKFHYQLIKAKEKPEKWKLWWHSHATMPCFWSGTDQQTIEDFDTEGKEHNWMMSLVTNHKEETVIRTDIYYPFRHTIEGIKMDIIFGKDIDRDIRRKVMLEIHEKVRFASSEDPKRRRPQRNDQTTWEPHQLPEGDPTTQTVAENGIIVLPKGFGQSRTGADPQSLFDLIEQEKRAGVYHIPTRRGYHENDN